MLRAVTAVLSLVLAASALAHSDPRGEISPDVFPDGDGNFRIFFYYGSLQPMTMSMVIAQDGSELIPRHHLSPTALAAFGIQLSNEGDGSDYGLPWQRVREPGSQIVLLPAGNNLERLVLLEPAPATQLSAPMPWQGRSLPFPPRSAQILADYTIGPQHIAIVTSRYRSDPEKDPVHMIFQCCARRGEAGQVGGVQVRLSNVAVIYDYVRTSVPVWAEGRFWIAWVRQLGDYEAGKWTTLLTGLDPVTGIAETHELPGISNWNTRVSLAVNANGTLCAAWAPSVDGSYPGTARIVTAVYPLRPPRPPLRF